MRGCVTTARNSCRHGHAIPQDAAPSAISATTGDAFSCHSESRRWHKQEYSYLWQPFATPLINQCTDFGPREIIPEALPAIRTVTQSKWLLAMPSSLNHGPQSVFYDLAEGYTLGIGIGF